MRGSDAPREGCEREICKSPDVGHDAKAQAAPKTKTITFPFYFTGIVIFPLLRNLLPKYRGVLTYSCKSTGASRNRSPKAREIVLFFSFGGGKHRGACAPGRAKPLRLESCGPAERRELSTCEDVFLHGQCRGGGSARRTVSFHDQHVLGIRKRATDGFGWRHGAWSDLKYI